MGINAQIRKTTFGAEDQSWLGSRTGTEDPDSITLDAAACIAIAEFASGTVPSGIPLKRAGSGRYAPAITAEVADRWLLHTVDLTAGRTRPPTPPPPACGAGRSSRRRSRRTPGARLAWQLPTSTSACSSLSDQEG